MPPIRSIVMLAGCLVSGATAATANNLPVISAGFVSVVNGEIHVSGEPLREVSVPSDAFRLRLDYRLVDSSRVAQFETAVKMTVYRQDGAEWEPVWESGAEKGGLRKVARVHHRRSYLLSEPIHLDGAGRYRIEISGISNDRRQELATVVRARRK